MRYRTWILLGAICVSLAAADRAAACGGYGSMEIEMALASESPTAEQIEKLRARGPALLDELLERRDLWQKQVDKFDQEMLDALATANHARATELRPQRERVQSGLARLDRLIDQVGMQRHCSQSRLFWYTDLAAAQQVAKTSGKPILSLRMLGKLNEDFSCANSRFFRTTLYANAEVSKALRENYVLHWQSVRPVPRVTIDFGDGRKLERTLTGNSAHYILTPAGEVVDVLPGLYGPRAFLEKVAAGASAARQLAAVDDPQRPRAIAQYHAERLTAVDRAWQNDIMKVSTAQSQVPVDFKTPPQPSRKGVESAEPPAANVAAKIAAPKYVVERPLVAAALALPLSNLSTPDKVEDEATWAKIAALHAEDAQLDEASRALIASENPTAAVAGRLAITKRRAEDPILALVGTLQESIALDTVRNEYLLHRRVHQWLAQEGYRPAVEVLNERVYAELFLTPSSDPWLGLAPATGYTALPNGGVVNSQQ
jgi:hypothetical protein